MEFVILQMRMIFHAARIVEDVGLPLPWLATTTMSVRPMSSLVSVPLTVIVAMELAILIREKLQATAAWTVAGA